MCDSGAGNVKVPLVGVRTWRVRYREGTAGVRACATSKLTEGREGERQRTEWSYQSRQMTSSPPGRAPSTDVALGSSTGETSTLGPTRNWRSLASRFASSGNSKKRARTGGEPEMDACQKREYCGTCRAGGEGQRAGVGAGGGRGAGTHPVRQQGVARAEGLARGVGDRVPLQGGERVVEGMPGQPRVKREGERSSSARERRTR